MTGPHAPTLRLDAKGARSHGQDNPSRPSTGTTTSETLPWPTPSLTGCYRPAGPIAKKGGRSPRRLNPQRRYAPFTITDLGVHDPDLSVHDGAIWVFTMAEIRMSWPRGIVRPREHGLSG